jgi:hypothetical protein
VQEDRTDWHFDTFDGEVEELEWKGVGAGVLPSLVLAETGESCSV